MATPNAPLNSEGFLRKTLYVVFTTPVKPREEIMKVIPDHLAYQVSLEQRGIMWGAGPLFDPQGNARCGMIVIRASSFEEAREIAEGDPMHARGMRTFTIDRWMMNEGTVTIRVTYSDQKMTIE